MPVIILHLDFYSVPDPDGNIVPIVIDEISYN